VGRSGSATPARERRTASDTERTAARWPISRSPTTSSMRSSFSVSPWSSLPVGMPVHAETTSATSSGPTRSAIIGASEVAFAASAASASAISFCTAGMSP